MRSDTHVIYVDKLTQQNLIAQYADIPPERIVEPDVVCEGTTLGGIRDSSFDFVIANHLLEHIPDPLMALDNWFRVLRSNGILYLTIPDMLGTFDADKPLTSLEHIIADNSASKENRRSDYIHFLEWVTYVHHKFPPYAPIPSTELGHAAMQLQQRIERTHGSIHYHTFVEQTILQLVHLVEKRCGARLIQFRNNKQPPSFEFISILQKL